MKIVLKNFKCFSAKVIEVPDTGMVLFSGKSGVGKTTILQAIYFILTGKGTKIQPLSGGSGCSVVMTYQDWEIKRSRRPNRLTLTSLSQKWTLEDQAAQKYLNDHFGEHFELTSYLQQKGAHSFLYASPADKLECLETMMRSNFDASGWEHKLSLKIKQTEQKKMLSEGERNVLAKLAEESQKNLDLFVKGKHLPYRSISTEKVLGALRIVEKNIKVSQKKIKGYNEEVVTLTAQKEQAYSSKKQRVLLSDRISHLRGKIIESLKVTNELVSESDISKMRIDLRKLRETLSDCKQKEQWTLMVKEQIASLENKLGALPYFEPWLDWKEEECESILSQQKKKKNLEQELDSTRKRLKTPIANSKDLQEQCDRLKLQLQASQKLVCVNCKCPLFFDGKVLCALPPNVPDAEERPSEEVLRRLNEKIKESVRAEAQFHMTTTRIEELQTAVSEIDVPTGLDFDKYYADNQLLERYLSEIESLENRLAVSSKTSPFEDATALQEQVSSLEKKLEQLVLKQQQHQRAQSEYAECSHEVQNLEGKMASLECLSVERVEEKLERCVKELNEWEVKMEGYSQKKNGLLIQKEYIELRDSFHAKKKQLKEKQIEIKIDDGMLSLCLKIKEKLLKAQATVLERAVESVNVSANRYLEAFFEQPLQIKLTCFKELKGGRTKVAIHLDVIQNNEPSDLSCLSGGEVDRVQLAMSLAFSEVFASPLLMLDETISSLDEETAERVLQTVRELSPNKLILAIAHQTVHGIFDETVLF